MRRNVGTGDSVFRIILGLVLLSLIFIGPKTWWGLIGIMPLSTGLLQSCPVYLAFGINTCTLPKQGKE